MAFAVESSGTDLVVRLTGWDRVMNWRRSVTFDLAEATGIDTEKRATLEASIDHRALGFGTHKGAKRPNRRRVGTMLGRSVVGKQFWAVEATSRDRQLLVVDLRSGEFVRAVLMVDSPERLARDLASAVRPR